MSNFENNWYNKGYEDGFSDAINNLEIGDILTQIVNFSEEEKQKLIEAISICE